MILWTLLWMHSVYGFERQLSATINPGCTLPECDERRVVFLHLSAVGPNDTLHYLWDFTGKPSFFLALTAHDAELSVDWRRFVWGYPQSVNFTKPRKYGFGYVVNKVLEFNDFDDTGVIDKDNRNSSYLRELRTENFQWKFVEFKPGDKRVEVVIEASHYESSDNYTVLGGTVRVAMSGYGFTEHSAQLPHLVHTANCSQTDLVLDGLRTSSGFSSSRFAVDLLLASEDPANMSMDINERKSLDDEYTPGVFTLVDLQTPSSSARNSGGYLQWRPVAYVAKERDISNSTETTNSGMNKIAYPTASLNNTLLSAVYGFFLDTTDILVQEITVVFGVKEDGFYKKTNYTSWTFMAGFGSPPSDDLSLLVILVISIGLGLPLLLVIVSCVVMGVRRISRRKDDLFLR